MNEEVRKALAEKAEDGRMSCALAREIAEDLGVPYKEVGEAADELGVKIKDCELGCF